MLTSIILFGSRARGKASRRADFDFLLIFEKVDSEMEIKLHKLRIEYLTKGIKIDFVAMSKEDAMANFEMSSPLFASLLLGFKVLYDDGFFRDNFRKMVEDIRNTKMLYAEGSRLWNLAKIASEILQ